MNSETETEIRALIALQQEIKDKQREVSKRLGEILEREKASLGTSVVIDGHRWEITRWSEAAAHVTRETFSAWCLEKKGKIL
jgi:hypothetical protein